MPCEPSSPLDIHRSCPIKPIHAISLPTQPDPTNPIDIYSSFSRCLAGATRTRPRPPDPARSRPKPLVSSNGNPTSHAKLGPPHVRLLRISLIAQAIGTESWKLPLRLDGATRIAHSHPSSPGGLVYFMGESIAAGLRNYCNSSRAFSSRCMLGNTPY